MSSQHAQEVEAGGRFSFGDNWWRFLLSLDEGRIRAAEESLRAMLHVDHLQGRSFLDVGSGSGLFSLAARRLGARVRSFDYDPRSVACTRELRNRYFPDDLNWTIEEASVLDETFMASIGTFDVVYSWGVLHHTGALHRALGNVLPTVAQGGQLFVAIYNDQGVVSRYWQWVKRVYNRGHAHRIATVALHAPYLFGMRWLLRTATNRHTLDRGMSLWHDMVDWLGGYPFEVAKPESIVRVLRDRQFVLEELRTCGGRMGCNEFVFRRTV